MIIYGKQPILYILNKDSQKIKRVFLIKDKKLDNKLFKIIKSKKIEVSYIDTKKAQAMAKGGNHQGLIADIDEVELPNIKKLMDNSNFILILHSITDMGNIGAIVRTAYSLGVDSIFITGVQTISYDKIIRHSSGAGFNMQLSHYHNIYDLINELKLKEFIIYGATLQGENIKNLDFTKDKKVLILGSENIGLPNRVISKLDKEITIQMNRDFDSLNVSVASAILIDRMR